MSTDFSWVGVAGYAAPAAGSAHFVWSVTPSTSGWSGTHFGAPRGVYNQAGTASGIAAAHTGFPKAQFSQAGTAAGIAAVRFGSLNGSVWQPASGTYSAAVGTPSAILGYGTAGWLATKIGIPQVSIRAVGWSYSALGLPSSSVVFSASSLGPTSVVPRAFFPFTQSGGASPAVSSVLGTPAVLGTSRPALGLRAQAYGAPSSVASVPAAAYLRKLTAGGVRTTAIGVPRASPNARAAGFCAPSFGAPHLDNRAREAGYSTTAMGTPAGRIGRGALGWGGAKFGAPACTRTRTYSAFPLAARHAFGQPSCTSHHPRSTVGVSLTHLGAPSGATNYHALHTAPTMRSGVATAYRS